MAAASSYGVGGRWNPGNCSAPPGPPPTTRLQVPRHAWASAGQPAARPSLCILLGPPSPTALVFKCPSPFFYVTPTFPKQSLNKADQPGEALGKTGRAPALPHPPIHPTSSPSWLLSRTAQVLFTLQASAQLVPPSGSPPTLIMLAPTPMWRTETQSTV